MNSPEINQEELFAFCARCGWNLSCAIEPIRQEASARRYLRLRPEDDSEPRVLSINPPFDAEGDDFLRISRLLEAGDLPAPRVFGADGARGWILLSDGGERDLADHIGAAAREGDEVARTAARRALLTAALDLMLRVHALPLDQPVAARCFDYEKLHAELEFLYARIRTLTERFGARSPLTFELEMFLEEVCSALDRELIQTGGVFTHRDYHSRNILVRTFDAKTPSTPPDLMLIDYQDARAGLPWYDLASLLWDPYINFTADEREAAYHYYLERSGKASPRAHDLYYAQALQRIFKALGTYLFQVYEKNAAVYYPSIDAALRRLEEIAQRGFFPDSVFVFVREFQDDLLKRLPAPPA